MTRYRVADGTQVHTGGRTYAAGEIVEADDRAAEWVRRGWATVLEPDDAEDAASGSETAPPPRSGPGSGREAWAAHAASRGLTVADDATRDEIIAELEAAETAAR